MAFQYCRLDKSRREIRQLTLLRSDSDSASGDGYLGIKCSLETTSLDESPSYTALSYTWGNPEITETIILNGEQFQVTVNLYAALRNLQREHEDTVLWVDAICINQNDNVEKSWQVQQMGDVYQQAIMVVIWLGPADDTSNVAMEKLARFGEQVKQENIVRLWEYRLQMTNWGNREALDLIGPLDGDNSLEDILGGVSVSDEDDATIPDSATRALLKRTWWQRMWVIQELALAREAVFHCGTKEVSIEPLAAALTVFRLYHMAKIGLLHQGPHNYVPPYIDLRPFMILSMRRGELLDFSVYKMPLMMHLQNFCPYSRAGRRMNATDPRDYVFALLGLSNSQHLGLLADYSKPRWLVYTELAKAHWGCFGVNLSLCQFPKLQNDLPSWVPDWSSCSMGRELPLGFEHGINKLILTNVLPQFEAEKNLVPPERLEQNHLKILRLHGIVVDIINGFMSNDERLQFFAWYDSSIAIENARKTLGLLLKPGHILTDQMIKDEIAKRLQVDEIDKEFGYFDRVTLKQGGSTGDYAKVERISFRKIEHCLDLARFITDSVRSLASTCGNIYGTPSLREEAIWRTLITDQEVDKDDIWHRPAKTHYYVNTLERLVRYNDQTCEDTHDFRMTARIQRTYDKLKEWDIVKDLNIEDVREVVYGKETDQFGFVLETAGLIPKAFTLGCMKDLGISLEQYEQAAERGEHPYDKADLYRRLVIKLQQAFEDLETDDPVKTLLENMKVAEEYLNMVRVQLLGRTVFVCKNGYLGLGPQHVQTGDVVAIVDGSPVPMVLRPIEDGFYQLVGESYVHGIMDGEAVGNRDIVVLEIK